jgi:hypothetical protein
MTKKPFGRRLYNSKPVPLRMKLFLMPLLLHISTWRWPTVTWCSSIVRDISGYLSQQLYPRLQILNGMFRVKPEPNDGVNRPTDQTFRFGVAVEELFDCLILFESKLDITIAAFGQVVRYLQNLCPKASASAILFDRRSFWLISSYKAVIEKVQKAMWIDGGSKSLFHNFIASDMSPFVTGLTKACSLLSVRVVEGDAFLGRGARGRVFKVINESGEVFALKIVDESFIRSLYHEEVALTKAQNTGLTIRLVGNALKFQVELLY